MTVREIILSKLHILLLCPIFLSNTQTTSNNITTVLPTTADSNYNKSKNLNITIANETDLDLPITKCRDRNRLTGSEKEDYYSLVEATNGRTVILQCHFCKENDDKEPKVWYTQPRLYNNTLEEVKLGMGNNVTLNRVHVSLEHSLVINNSSYNDTGLYLCEGIDGQESEYKFNYFLDFIVDETRMVEIGDEEAWRRYHEEHLYPLNKLFRGSSGSEFSRIRETLGLTVELYTEWDGWSPCAICGRPKGKGITTRYGHCRLKIIPIQKQKALNMTNNKDEKNFISMDRISCGSEFFRKLFPYIGNLTKNLPDFREAKFCKGVCAAEGLGFKAGKTKSFKYLKTFVLTQGSHLAILCPEATLENQVVWKRNGKVLPSGDSVPPPNPDDEPHITVDTFGTLYLREVTAAEEGNYTCQVDDIRMQQVMVFVVSKWKLLTEALVRHLIYLGFILSLTIFCYCAGLIIVCRNRGQFKTYEELKKEAAKKQKWKYVSSDETDEELRAFLKSKSGNL